MSESNSTQGVRTPWHLWVIGGIALLWSAMGAFDYLMSQTENEAYMGSFPPEQLDFFYSLPTWVVAFWAIGVWGGVLGTVLLLLRRRLAVPVYAASLVGAVITTFQNYVLDNALEVMGATGLVFAVVILLVAVALFLYSRAMRNQGVLV